MFLFFSARDFGGRALVTPVHGWRNAQVLGKTAAQGVRVGKAALRRDLLGRVMAGLQQFTGCGHAHGFHPGGWRHADFRLEQPREMPRAETDRKSTRLNSSHLVISYAVFCLKKKGQKADPRRPVRLPVSRREP